MPGIYDDLDQLYMWNTHGENCTMCNSLRGRVYSYDMWASSGVWPGFHLNCDCTLKKVSEDTPSSDPDFFGTDLNLLSETINWDWGPFRLHWDSNFQPYSWYMTQQIKDAHLTYGAQESIGDVLRKMKDQFLGFFKRSNLFDNFFVWRTFRTVQHYQNIDGGYQGERQSLWPRTPFYKPRVATGSTFTRYDQTPYLNSMLKPDTLSPLYPYQSYYTERRH